MTQPKNVHRDHRSCPPTRRDFVGHALATLGLGVGLPTFLRETNLAWAAQAATGQTTGSDRILVVLELSGGNDGLNTVVPFTRDEYYRSRPTLGVPRQQVLALSDELGLHPNLLGWERLYKEGDLAIVQGCGYPNPNRSHFEAMKFWHSGVPNAPESHGWVGRLADAVDPEGRSGLVVNVAREQSQAVASANHPAVVFSDPQSFLQEGTPQQQELMQELLRRQQLDGNASLEFVRRVAQTASGSSDQIRHACAEYRSRSDYGYGPVGVSLRNIAALIASDSPARFYYTNFGGFDTHVSQGPMQAGLFDQIGDAVLGFQRDVAAAGRSDEVVLLVFTEFGRRVQENRSFGTDHGVATPMFLFGKPVKGGFYGEHPSLEDLDDGDLKMTTDFRSVYATVIQEWMGYQDSGAVLRSSFDGLGIIT
jgi:uncharacterized protein (DUF1501 family)